MRDVTAPVPLTLEAVTIAIGGRPLFAPLSLTVPPGGVVTIKGASGSGKSTLLSHLCGTLAPDFTATGRASLGDSPLDGLPPEHRRMGILFQDDLLFPHLSVGGNLAFGLPAGLDRAERAGRIATALEEAGMVGFEARDPATLSGGQRARVACLRTLLAEPRALLLDEPFSKLDTALRGRFRAFVFEHARARALPTLLVTHDPSDAEAAGGPVIDLEFA
ncbi:ATP-binding cassette domain-containing protein [Marivibrio halodurans]|uniref:ATP-binding cassette domain-containing protein n=1 Tax=Marivibrio halodurans TaxID=2039722 RepID=A0A8J7V4C3_9PROT|nr:ATP-binding cassette domain-containing protein [Marivibrio halodurans]MBP5858927.1 ATP-binding cassette domain-containing protein [Marivibrio halodurans]